MKRVREEVQKQKRDKKNRYNSSQAPFASVVTYDIVELICQNLIIRNELQRTATGGAARGPPPPPPSGSLGPFDVGAGRSCTASIRYFDFSAAAMPAVAPGRAVSAVGSNYTGASVTAAAAATAGTMAAHATAESCQPFHTFSSPGYQGRWA